MEYVFENCYHYQQRMIRNLQSTAAKENTVTDG